MMCLGTKDAVRCGRQEALGGCKRLKAFPFNDIFTWASFATIRFIVERSDVTKKNILFPGRHFIALS